MRQGELLWTPSEDRIRAARMTAFIRWLADQRGVKLDGYPALWQWSVDHLEVFWAAIWDYFDIQASTPYECVLRNPQMPGAQWFPGARLNYAEHILRHADQDDAAIQFASERTPLQALSWPALERQVRILGTRLREFGIEPGDRVAAFMPNIPETIVAFLASASIGAVWSSCSTDFGSSSVIDRFSQIEPKILFGVDGYYYGGKEFDRRGELRTVVDALPSVEQVIYLPYLDPGNDDAGVPGVKYWNELVTGDPPADFQFEQLPFEHPLWIVYSSGTTGLPKAIVHGHGGVTLEMHKVMGLTINLDRGKCMFFYTTSGWIMWNVLVSALIVGARNVLYDGNPASPEVDVLWRLAAETRATSFGASPTYVSMMEKNDVVPREKYDYSALEGILLSGSPVTPESMKWLYDNVRSDLWVTSQSGGTDVASGFVSGSVILPVYAGEIQARALAVDVQAYNDAGESVIDEVGELVVVQPMPSMPLYFWNDEDDARYRGSYFDMFPGVWRHGDFLLINERGGCFIQGRSDSTLNRHGVRIGTAEIYRAVERVEEVEDSLIVNLDLPNGKFFMPLFVTLVDGLELDDELKQKIRDVLRRQCSPRHVPDNIYQLPSMPYTLTGKKLEVPVRKILMGVDPDTAVSRDAMQNPDAIDYFIEFVHAQRDYRLDT